MRGARLILTIFFTCMGVYTLHAQDTLDSLESVYLQGTYSSEQELDLLRKLSEQEFNPQKQLIYSDSLIAAAKRSNELDFLFGGYLNKGNACQRKGDLTEALDSYFQAATVADELDSSRYLGITNVAIADVYSIRGNHANAVLYYERAIDILRNEGNRTGYGTALENLGDEYLNYGMPDSALYYFGLSGKVFEEIDFEEGIAYNLGNRGIAYALQGRHDSAKLIINQAVTKLEIMEDYYPISVYLTYMSDIYLEQGNWIVAMSYAQRSLEIAMRNGLKDQASDANLTISDLHEVAGNHQEALDYYRKHIAYRDSVNNIASVQEMAKIRTDFAIAQKQTEVDLLNEERRNNQIIIIATAITIVLLGILAFGLYRRYLFINRTSKIIEYEKNRSDHLLLNILPEETAQELKEHGKVQARRFEEISVLFADFKGFTRISDSLSPEQVVKSVDHYFSKFDMIIEKHGIEKIKTMGDAYMCAAGLHDQLEDHAERITRAAVEMADFVDKAREQPDDDIYHFEVRIGINTGPVVAGVVGTKKFAYDIWGDTVNIASRMESNSEAGRINISENTYALIRELFDCEYRGEIDVRNKGRMKMYFVNPPEFPGKTTSIASDELQEP